MEEKTPRSEAIQIILAIMAVHKITPQEIAAEIDSREKTSIAMMNELQFDVAVIGKGEVLERIPLDNAGCRIVKGIYPFKDGPYKDCYLELDEHPELRRDEAILKANGRQNLPEPQFWQELEAILPGLNKVLEQLNASPVVGSYYTKSFDKAGSYIWTITGTGRNDYAPYSPIKARYIGRYGR